MEYSIVELTRQNYEDLISGRDDLFNVLDSYRKPYDPLSSVSNQFVVDEGDEEFIVLGCFGEDLAGNENFATAIYHIDNKGPVLELVDSSNAYAYRDFSTWIYYVSDNSGNVKLNITANEIMNSESCKFRTDTLGYVSLSEKDNYFSGDITLDDDEIIYYVCEDSLGNKGNL